MNLSDIIATISETTLTSLSQSNFLFFNGLYGIWNEAWWIFVSGICWYFTYLQVWDAFLQPSYRMANFYWVHLQIEVPDDNEVSPKAMESILLGIAGSHDTLDWQEYYWEGAYQPYYTLEVVSIEGNVKFIVSTLEQFKDNVKAQFYAHYPGSVIKEVDDYCQTFPDDFYNKGYDLHGGHMMLQNNDCWPIRTYDDWINKSDNIFVDPMMTLVEFMGSLGKTEQAWLHISIMPLWNQAWAEESWQLIEDIVTERLSKNIEESQGNDSLLKELFGQVKKQPRYFAKYIAELLLNNPAGFEISEDEDMDEGKLVFQQLTPAEQGNILLIAKNAHEVGFHTRIRYLYGGKADIVSKPRGFSGMVGVFKQYADLELNSFKPDLKRTCTRAKFFLKKPRLLLRKRRLLRWTKGRIWARGIDPFILTTSEIATIWHLPLAESKTPTLRKVESKTESPPTDLPIIENVLPIISSPS